MKTPILIALVALLLCTPARADEFDIPPQLVEAFARNLQDALSKQDRERVVSLVRFPLRVNTEGRKTMWVSKARLQKDFDQIFTPAVIQQVLDDNPAGLFQNYQGVMFGRGAVWADEWCGSRRRPDCPVLIFAINRGTP